MNSRAKSPVSAVVLVFLLLLTGVNALAETGEAAWLRYARLDPQVAKQYDGLPATTTVVGSSPLLTTAQSELVRGVRGMLGRTLRIVSGSPSESAIVITTLKDLRGVDPKFKTTSEISEEGFAIQRSMYRGQPAILIVGGSDRGALYGTFAFLSKMAQGVDVSKLNEVQNPSAPIRWINQWDNLDGTIERGYGGRSIFFDKRSALPDLSRAAEFARLMASVGINGCDVTNVNSDIHIVDTDFIPQLARIADVFRPYGVRLGIAVNVSIPKQVGGLDTFDPLDPKVATWWQQKFDEVYKQIPDFGGVVVKADSEGQLGPSVYGRSPADAANVIAKALKPHGGVVFYRAFVYNHHLDWNDPKADRARAAYDIFHPLDGKFEDNVIIQIKNGPIDFQVREPASSLFSGLEKTSQAIELQITQEYLGQEKHTVYLAPMWKEVLDFDMRVKGGHTPVKQILSGKTFSRPLGGYVGVANVGLDKNWMGNHLAQANLYAFGRLAWNPDLGARQIVDEWTRMTFGNTPDVVNKVGSIQMDSWPTYENYSGTLGLQTLTNITGPHYGPGPDSQERNGWGQWIRADKEGVGMDRSVKTGTGYSGQYSSDVHKMYEDVSTTPENLILFFHHLPYTYKLKSGKTVIQSIYDSHYDGAARAAEFVKTWKSLRGAVDDGRFDDVLAQLSYQSGHAIVWRDAINNWFHRWSGIADSAGRVGNHPGRVEAEAMELKGYQPADVVYWEGASGGKAVVCGQGAQSCSAGAKFNGSAGWYEVDIEYFDQVNGVSKYRLYVGDQLQDEWVADKKFPTNKPDADSSTRYRSKGVALRPGDVIRVEGIPDGGEKAPLDYIEVVPERL